MEKQQHGLPLFRLPQKHLALLVGKVIINVIHRHQNHAIDLPGIKPQVLPRRRPLNARQTLRLIGFILKGLAHVEAEFVIAHGHEAVPGNFQKLRRKPVTGQGDKIKQIPRVNQKCPHFVGKGRAFPKIPFRTTGVLPFQRPPPAAGPTPVSGNRRPRPPWAMCVSVTCNIQKGAWAPISNFVVT